MTSEYTASQKRPLSIVEQLSQLDARQSLVVTHPATPRRRLLIIVDSSVNCLYAYFMPFRRYSVTKNSVDSVNRKLVATATSLEGSKK